MKKTILNILAVAAGFAALASCEHVLDPLPNGHVTDENIDDYASYTKGFIEKAYILSTTKHYLNDKYLYSDCATDDGVMTDVSAVMRKFAQGTLSPEEDPFLSIWANDYQGIYYANRFLKDNKGLNTQYLIGHVADSLLRHNYHGDAFALRAWFHYDLLKRFAGKDLNGKVVGIPVIDSYMDASTANPAKYERLSVDDCVKQIIKDLDSAMLYLPIANREWYAIDQQAQGACRWQKFDQQSATALKALTYLLWASDAFNPGKDVKRWELAAQEAYKVIRYKLDIDGAHGFNPLAAYDFLDPNNKDALLISRDSGNTDIMEVNQYPVGFRGNATYAPSQNLVDAFPMANGYPITDKRSGYDPQNPYESRDPRFYATIFYNGAQLKRIVKPFDEMYTFETFDGGKDMAGGQQNGLTNFYLKKHIYLGWNASDQSIQTMPRCVTYIGWRDMIFAFAEAANRAVGPTSTELGMSAKEALAYIRNRTTTDGVPGLGINGDPYLDECSSDAGSFEQLLRNEYRIEFCFEGHRLYDLIRWDVPLKDRNIPVYAAQIKLGENGKATYGKSEIYRIHLNSQFLPIPFADMQRASSLVENEGWANWSRQ